MNEVFDFFTSLAVFYCFLYLYVFDLDFDEISFVLWAVSCFADPILEDIKMPISGLINIPNISFPKITLQIAYKHTGHPQPDVLIFISNLSIW